MRKVRYEVAASLDNFVVDADGGLDWLMFCDEVGERSAELMSSVDTLLMGRKTFDYTRRHSDRCNYTEGINTYVFSKSLEAVPAGMALIKSEPGAFVRDLKKREGKDLWLVGGGVLASALIEAGVVDQININLHPVFLSKGMPMLGSLSRAVPLKLVASEPLSNGCVYMSYEVKV